MESIEKILHENETILWKGTQEKAEISLIFHILIFYIGSFVGVGLLHSQVL